jgi:hypothetical protein
MSNNTVAIKPSNVMACEWFRATTPGTYNYNHHTESRTFVSANKAKEFIRNIAGKYDIDATSHGRKLVQSLCLSMDFDGLSSTDYKECVYTFHGQNGEATYVLFVLDLQHGFLPTVSYSYQHVDESIFGTNLGWTFHAGEITMDWLKYKACKSLKERLPYYSAPEIKWT